MAKRAVKPSRAKLAKLARKSAPSGWDYTKDNYAPPRAGDEVVQRFQKGDRVTISAKERTHLADRDKMQLSKVGRVFEVLSVAGRHEARRTNFPLMPPKFDARYQIDNGGDKNWGFYIHDGELTRAAPSLLQRARNWFKGRFKK